MKIYIDGKYYGREDARVSVFNHGLLYGDGVFEGIRIYNGKVFRLKEHIERLYQSAKAILLEIPVKKEEMKNAVLETVKINAKENGYIRLIVTRGEGSLGIDPAQCNAATIIIIVADIQLYPEEHYKNGIEIITASSRRIPPDSLDPRIKSLNYLNNIMAKLEARQAGCLEAVMLNREGFVSECTGDNIFILKNNELLTPAPYHGALDGITMRTVMEIAESLGIRTRETTLTRYDLYNADECFMTGTGAEIIPVIKADSRIIGDGMPGTITRSLTDRFKQYVLQRAF
ncbi:MAG TPA: branched-chain-amino-acid transaminase [Nitrospirae bacterium]|nr:branched-chain-amino-acid aminotransferase [bacterium BMS3Abin06]HDH11736.1 branched-chain-amino-acid transaminase [Nitrospirota bacterium]HDZ02572.1 branched-chain-amino-acid transaminase [Nitrospirota bacterium]